MQFTVRVAECDKILSSCEDWFCSEYKCQEEKEKYCMTSPQ